jgi:PAS domain S-box-containing protein
MRMKMIVRAASMLALVLTASPLRSKTHPALPLLTQAAQIRKLTAEQARLGYPVELRGVITFYAPDFGLTFMQDASAGIFLNVSGPAPEAHPGDLVEVEGVTGRGEFAPVVDEPKIRVVGRAPLPTAPRFSVDDLLTGQQDAAWVEVRGIVRSLESQDVTSPDGSKRTQALLLRVASGRNQFHAWVQSFPHGASYATPVGAEVTVRGACAAIFNDKRQLIGIQLFVPSLDQVHVEEAAGPDPWALDVSPMNSLMQFSPQKPSGHRIRVQGVVTVYRHGSSLFLQDASGGVEVVLNHSIDVQPGGVVDAIGFPAVGQYAPILEDGEARRVGPGTLPQPLDLTHAATLTAGPDAELVKIDGRLTDRSVSGDDLVLTMQTRGSTFTAHLERAAPNDPLWSIPMGSQLVATGVWSIRTDEYHNPVAFRVLLRSARDIVVLERPSWWTAKRVAWLLSVLAAIVIWISLWVLVLRWRVEERTETVRATLESTADGILVLNSAGRIVTYNRKLAEMWHIPESLLEARHQNLALDYILSQMKDPAAFFAGDRQGRADTNAQTDDVIEFKDGRVFERHSEPQRVMGRNVGRVWGFRDVTERRRAEEELHHSRQMLRLVLDNIPQRVFWKDRNSRYLGCNRPFASDTGLQNPEEVVGKNDFDLSWRDLADLYRADDMLVMEKGAPKLNFDEPEKRADGSMAWLRTSKLPLRDREGKVIGVIGTYEDITERKRAERALQERTAYLNALIENNPLAIVTVDMRGRVKLCNPAFERLFLYRQEEIEGADLDELVAPSEFLSEAVAWSRQCQNGIAVRATSRRRRKDGSLVDVELYGVPMVREGAIVGHFALYQDISERKQAEAALIEERYTLHTLMDNLPDHIYFKDRQSRFIRINKAQAKVFGLSDPAQAKGKTDFDFFSDEHAQQAFADEQEIIRTGQPVLAKEEKETWPDARETWVATTKMPLRDAKANIIGTFGISRDITERRQLEEQFRQAHKMEAVGRLAAGVAHDFNNLLTVVIGYSDLLLKRLAASDRLRSSAQEIKKAGERAAWLIRQLLAFSRMQVLQPQVLDLGSLLRNAEQMLARVIGEDIEVDMRVPPGLGHVKADPGQIEQVIMNLAVNARDAMPQGGRLTLEAANVELDVTYARSHRSLVPGRYVMLVISDTGTGMNEETKAHIFEPFFTTKELGKGTGLGLSTVYGIVKQSGGFIYVYSEPGNGATFRIYLPRVDQPVEETPPGELSVEEPSPGSETILLVEDEEAVRSLARQVLESRGYRVLETDGATKALELAAAHKEQIQLLLTDVVMPHMNGKELARHLAPLHPETKVLFMSGHVDNVVVHNGVLDPGTAFLQKPFTARALARRLREVLDGAGDRRTDVMACEPN